MRKVTSEGKVAKAVCNACGKELRIQNGIVQEGCFSVRHVFDFFSEKDGEVHQFDLCEACYDKMIARFQLPVDVEEAAELL